MRALHAPAEDWLVTRAGSYAGLGGLGVMMTVSIDGTLAARYLASRGLCGPYPATLRFLSRFKYPRRELDHIGPVMVAAVSRVSP